MFHDANSPRAPIGGTFLSRFRARAFPKTVLPDGVCSVHATEALADVLARLCGVKVKLRIAVADRDSVLTQEVRGKVRIPDVCDGPGVKWLELANMIEHEDWTS
jgi:hypothetical protein